MEEAEIPVPASDEKWQQAFQALKVKDIFTDDTLFRFTESWQLQADLSHVATGMICQASYSTLTKSTADSLIVEALTPSVLACPVFHPATL